MYRLIHQQRPSQIPPTLLSNPSIQLLRHDPPLLLRTPLKHITNLHLRRRRNPNQQCPTPDRRNDIRRTVRQQYEPQVWTILLHRPPQRRLRIPRQMIRLIDNHDLWFAAVAAALVLAVAVTALELGAIVPSLGLFSAVGSLVITVIGSVAGHRGTPGHRPGAGQKAAQPAAHRHRCGRRPASRARSRASPSSRS